MSWTYRIFDLLLESNLPIPALNAVQSSNRKRINVHFAPRTAPNDDLWDHQPSFVSPYSDDSGKPLVQIWRLPQGEAYRLHYLNGLDFVLDYKRNSISATWPLGDLSFDDAASYLLGPVLGIMLRLQGETCLHASAVAIDGTAVVFVGPPEAGKSTTAAVLNQRGYALIADDIVLLREDAVRRFCAVPSYPCVSLWPESVEFLSKSPESLPRVFPKLEKRRLSSRNFEGRALPIGAIYILGERISNLEARFSSLSAQAAIVSLIPDTYGSYALDPGRRANELQVLSRVVAQVPVCRLHASADKSCLSSLCDRILEDYRNRVSGTTANAVVAKS